jgi:hypothetical protein
MRRGFALRSSRRTGGITPSTVTGGDTGHNVRATTTTAHVTSASAAAACGSSSGFVRKTDNDDIDLRLGPTPQEASGFLDDSTAAGFP